MNVCEKCGHKSDGEDKGIDMRQAFSDSHSDDGDNEDEELKAKDDVLAELIDIMDGSLESKLKAKKPSSISIEMLSAKPKKDDEEEV